METKDYALNLADITTWFQMDDTNFPAYIEATGCRRIVVGSYVCGKYYMKSMNFGRSIFPLAQQKGYKISVVAPLTLESQADMTKNQTGSFLYSNAGLADEVIVNDYAMLQYMYELREAYGGSYTITAGRLFFKNYRDPRYDAYQDETLVSYFPQFLEGKVGAVELDMCSRRLDVTDFPADVRIHMHYPLVYMTNNQKCEFAAAQSPDSAKFRNFSPCGMNCAKAVIHTKTPNAEFYHFGKGVYGKVPEDFHLIGRENGPDRYIYCPLLDFLEMEKDAALIVPVERQVAES